MMSRTKHLTRAEADASSRPTRKRAKSRLTKHAHVANWYEPNQDRPANRGNKWRAGNNAGQRRRKVQREAKVIGRRLERRRLNRELLP